MESTHAKPPEGVTNTDTNWRTQLSVANRQMVVRKLSEKLMKSSSSGPQDAPSIESLAVKFEEKVFAVATSKEDYCRKISYKLKEPKPHPQQSLSGSSLPGPAYPVRSSTNQASPQPQNRGSGKRLEMQSGFQRHPSSPIEHQKPHQSPVICNQGAKMSQQKLILQQPRSPIAINSWLHGKQRAVPDLMTQHKLNGFKSHFSGNKNQQVNASTCNGHPSNISMQENQVTVLRVPKTVNLQGTSQMHMQSRENNIQGTPPAQQVQVDLQETSQMHVQPRENNIQGMPPAKQAQGNLLRTSQMHMQPRENNTQVLAQGTSQAIHSVGDDWKEELFEKITRWKDECLPALKVKYSELFNASQKMNSIPQYQRTANYERLQKQLVTCKKLHVFLHLPRESITEEVRKLFPRCEEVLFSVLQDRSQGNISVSQQKQLLTGDAQTLKQSLQLQSQNEQLVTAQVEVRQLQQRETTEFLAHHGKQRSLQHHQQSVNLERHSSSPYSVDPVQPLVKEKESIIHWANTGDIQPQATSGPQYLSSSDLVGKNVDVSGNRSHNSGRDLSESSVVETPIQRLLKAARSMSQNAFSASVRDMDSVLQTADRTAGTLAGNGLKLAVGVNLAETTTLRYGIMQSVNSQTTPIHGKKRRIEGIVMSCNEFSTCDTDMESVLKELDATAEQLASSSSKSAVGEDLFGFDTCCYDKEQDVSPRTIQRNVCATAIPVGSFDGLDYIIDHLASPLEPSIDIHDEKARVEANCNLLEEIKEINRKLIETVVKISLVDVMFEPSEDIIEGGKGTVVKCSYTPVAVAHLVPSIKPLQLLVPIDYPACSPVVLDKPPEVSLDCEDLSAKAKSRLILSLKVLHNPLSLADLVRTWDTCARAVISEFAQKSGGGSFSSTYGTWEHYPSVA